MPNFLARSRAPFTRFGASLIVRIPWSVKFIDIMNVGIRFSLNVVCLRAAIMRRGFCGDKAGARDTGPWRPGQATCTVWAHTPSGQDALRRFPQQPAKWD